MANAENPNFVYEWILLPNHICEQRIKFGCVAQQATCNREYTGLFYVGYSWTFFIASASECLELCSSLRSQCNIYSPKSHCVCACVTVRNVLKFFTNSFFICFTKKYFIKYNQRNILDIIFTIKSVFHRKRQNTLHNTCSEIANQIQICIDYSANQHSCFVPPHNRMIGLNVTQRRIQLRDFG